MSIILDGGGFTIKHKEEAKIGDIWKDRYNPVLVSIVEILDLYITIDPMNDKSRETLHKYDFYRGFFKVDSYSNDVV